jgi:hypothetical protein
MVRSEGLVLARNVEKEDAVRRAAAIDPIEIAGDQADQEDKT